jgi:hypothetical protein
MGAERDLGMTLFYAKQTEYEHIRASKKEKV